MVENFKDVFGFSFVEKGSELRALNEEFKESGSFSFELNSERLLAGYCGGRDWDVDMSYEVGARIGSSLGDFRDKVRIIGGDIDSEHAREFFDCLKSEHEVFSGMYKDKEIGTYCSEIEIDKLGLDKEISALENVFLRGELVGAQETLTIISEGVKALTLL
ncbi:hypothetical protein HNV12_00950 [Methanococcoides sp. SA1]|nr:hypothetical protein [Methanococcoides sp. SA1]